MKNFKFKGPWLKCWQKNAATLLYAIGVFCIFYSSAQAGPENGRIGYWTFDTVNIGKVEDISGHGLGGRLKGDVQLIEGKIGKALDFKDGTSYVEISHQNILNLSQEMSISLWFHPDSVPASYSVPILKKFTTTADAQVALYYFGATSTNPGSVAVYGNAGGGWKVLSPYYVIPKNTWTHLAWSYRAQDGGQLYMNGRAVGTLTGHGTLQNNAIPLIMGSADGKIDEVMFFNRALNREEVFEIFIGAQPFYLEPLSPVTIFESDQIKFKLSTYGKEGRLLTYTCVNAPEHAFFDGLTQTFTWQPARDQAGTYKIYFRVSDGKLEHRESIHVKVKDRPIMGPCENAPHSICLTEAMLGNPFLFFRTEAIPSLRQDADLAAYYGKYYENNQTKIPGDWSSPDLMEYEKSQFAMGLAMNVLLLDPLDPLRSQLTEKVKQALLHMNHGLWTVPKSTERIHFHWDGSNDVHHWYLGGVLQNYAMAYDWLRRAGLLRDDPGRADDDFDKIRSRLLLLAAVEYKKLDNAYSVPGVDHLRIANYRFRSLGGLGTVLLATLDHKGFVPDPENLVPGKSYFLDAAETLQWILKDLLVHENSMPSTDDSNRGTLANNITQEGAYLEGLGYINDSFNVFLPFTLAFERVTNRSLLREGDLTDGRIVKMFDWQLKTMMPNKQYSTFDTGFFGKLYGHEVIAPYAKKPGSHYWYVQNIALGYLSGVYRLFVNATDIVPETPAIRTEFFEDSGNTVFRDKWGPDATYMMFLAEHYPNRSYHEQADQTSFSIYAKNAYLAIDPGDGRAYGWSTSEEQWLHYGFGHNLILVDSTFSGDPSKTSTESHPTINYAFNSVKDPAYLQNSFASERLDFSEARMTYSGVNVDLVRSIAFSRHQYFIILDDLKAQESHTYKWQIHFGSSPEAVATDHLDQNGDSFTWTMKNENGGSSSLDLQFLKGPESYEIHRQGPTNYVADAAKVYHHTYVQAVSRQEDHVYLSLLNPRYANENGLTVRERVAGKVWEIRGNFSGHDILVSQPSTQSFTYGNLTTDATFLLASFEGEGAALRLKSVLSKGGTIIQIQDGERLWIYSPNVAEVFYREIKKTALGDSSGDGKITAYDSALASKIALRGNPTSDELKRADVNSDGKIDAADAVLIAKKAVWDK